MNTGSKMQTHLFFLLRQAKSSNCPHNVLLPDNNAWVTPYFCERNRLMLSFVSTSSSVCKLSHRGQFSNGTNFRILRMVQISHISNGANFRIFRTHTDCAEIRTYENFHLRSRAYSILSQCTATFCLLRHSKSPCKYGSRVSSPWMVKEAWTMSREIWINLTRVPGGATWRTRKNSKIRT